MKCIAYTRQDGGVSVIYPSPEYMDKIEMIADKDTPSGIYYKFIETSEMPSRETREAWELNLDANNSDGIGLTKEEFETKYPEYKGMAVQ
jgi:hypothetical protein